MSNILYRNYTGIKLTARYLRKNTTPSEKILWQQLKEKKIGGFKFLRQHPIFYRIDKGRVEYFIVDFYCSRLRLIIELDGPLHNFSKARDKEREIKLRERGFIVKRIKNEELENINKVLSELKDFILSINFYVR